MKKISFILFFIALTIQGFSQTWTPLTSGTTHDLFSIYATDASTCYVSGMGGIMLKTIDGGLTWTSQNTGTSQDLYSICFTDALHGFAVGDGGAARKTSNGGATWTSAGLGTSQLLRTVYFINADTGFIAGGTSGGPGLLYRTIDAGTTWTAISTSGASTSTIYGIFFTSPTVGYANDFNKNVIKTTNGGTTWAGYNGGGSGSLNGGIYFTSANDGLVTGSSGSIRRTTDAGLTWSAVSGAVSTDVLTHMDFYDSSNGFIVGGNIGANTGVILNTTDGGASWTSYIPGTTRLTKIDMVNANTGYIVGRGGVILKYTSSIGINEIKQPIIQFTSYPNPFNTQTTINTGNYTFTQMASVNVYDIAGKPVKTASFDKGQEIILDRNQLAKGMYVYKIYDGKEYIGSGKMTIE